MEVLLEVVAQREVEERPPVRGQLHRRGQPALHDGEVAGGEVRGRGRGRRRGPRARRARAATPGRCAGRRRRSSAARARAASPPGTPSITRRSRCSPTPEPPTVTMQTCSSAPVAELGAQRARGRRTRPGRSRSRSRRSRSAARSSRGSAAGRGRSASGTMSSGSPTKIARSRTRGIARDVLDHLGVVVGGQERLALAAVGHRQPADEVGQPDVGGRFCSGFSCR